MEPDYLKRWRLMTTDVKMDFEKMDKNKKLGKMNEKKVFQIDPKDSNINPLSKKIHS
jgi:hypothetical protein